MEQRYPDLVAVDSEGCMTGKIMDFCRSSHSHSGLALELTLPVYWERLEMCAMSKASEISANVYMGPTPDATLESSSGDQVFDVHIEAHDLAHVPDPRSLNNLRARLQDPNHSPLHIEFPSSGSIMPPTWSHAKVDSLMETCKWIYEVANPQEVNKAKEDKDNEGGSIELATIARPQKVLIHCTDGYTESSLLGLAYFMYAKGLPAHDAWVQLHREKGRNFFAYPTDVALLTAIQPRILQASPRWRGDFLSISEPEWLSRIDGSLPSRILPYMYLGNLGHANNPELLRELGITRILSVGESISWPEDLKKKLNWSNDDLLSVDRVQDNGVDPLWNEFDRCLKFIGEWCDNQGAAYF